MPKNAVYVGRPTRWGNPIAFTDVSGQFPSLNERQVATLVVRQFEALAQRGSLHLPDQPCHADVLLELANKGGS